MRGGLVQTAEQLKFSLQAIEDAMKTMEFSEEANGTSLHDRWLLFRDWCKKKYTTENYSLLMENPQFWPHFDQVSLRFGKNDGFFINRELFSVVYFFLYQSLDTVAES